MKHNSTAKEQVLHPTAITRTEVASLGEEIASEFDDRMKMALHAAAEKKAIDIVVLDLREIASFTDYFVITSGANERQVQAIADEVSETLKKAGSAPARVEGYKSAEWILLDFGDFLFHVFDQKARAFYDLERLWRASKRVPLPEEIETSSLRKES